MVVSDLPGTAENARCHRSVAKILRPVPFQFLRCFVPLRRPAIIAGASRKKAKTKAANINQFHASFVMHPVRKKRRDHEIRKKRILAGLSLLGVSLWFPASAAKAEERHFVLDGQSPLFPQQSGKDDTLELRGVTGAFLRRKSVVAG